MANLKEIVQENFSRYAGNVILDRAICDARDMLKPSARMLMYSQMHITKNVPSKPFIKSARVVGDCLGRYYVHGDSSCYGTYMRMAKPFAMRYPLEDCQGNSGTITQTGDEAHQRYTELRLSPLGNLLFTDIEKDAVKEWCDNFDETETYPKILPSKGFYNIVNGTMGIGVSLSSSIPQFNIKDINNALIKLIDNPNYEIDILPDFATGAYLINPSEVKESLKNGCGAACKLRSVIEYDEREKALIVKEIPFGVYTNTISEQIAALIEKYPNCGIEKINDGSGKKPDYMIYLNKNANPERVIKLLYKETSLQTHYTINMTVLTEKGKTPRVMGLKELLLEHIKHECEIYKNSFEFDLNKIEKRLHIIDGFLICFAQINEVVAVIKNSADTNSALNSLQLNFLLDEEQAKAVLNMKLSRLAHLEVEKLVKEKNNLLLEAERINNILSNKELFNNEIKKDWQNIINKFGDERRTKILDLKDDENGETIEEKNLLIHLTNKNNIYVTETTTLITARRGTKGKNIKLLKNEQIIDNNNIINNNKVLMISNLGKVYSLKFSEMSIINNKISLNEYLYLEQNEKIIKIINCDKNIGTSLFFITKSGTVKKTYLTEYIKSAKSNKKGSKGIKLKENDIIINAFMVENDKVGILTKGGKFNIISSESIKNTGKNTIGVIGIKLKDDDCVVSAKIINKEDNKILFITKHGMIICNKVKDYDTNNRGAMGVNAQKLYENDESADFVTCKDEDKEIIIITNSKLLNISFNEIKIGSKNTIGVKSIDLNKNDTVIGVIVNG